MTDVPYGFQEAGRRFVLTKRGELLYKECVDIYRSVARIGDLQGMLDEVALILADAFQVAGVSISLYTSPGYGYLNGAVTDANGRPISLFMTAGQVSDYTGAAALLDSLPRAQWLLGDRGYDADWFRDALQAKGIMPCIPGRKTRTEPIRYDKRRYKRRNRIEIMFGRLKDWRRVATRYDRCPNVFLSAIALAATVLFWL